MKSKKPKYRIDNKKLTRLVEKAQKGDERALEQIVTESSRYIYFYSLMMLQSVEKAQDAVQDVLLTLIQKINTINNPAFFLSWLKIVTANYCKNRISREREEYSLDDSFEYIVDDSDQVNPSKSVENSEFRAVILDAVRTLPPSQRESVMMFYYQQLTTREIAEALSISESTVKSRLRYARNSIRDKLEKYGKNNLMLSAPPMSLISHILISEAEKQPRLILPDTALGHEIFIASVKSTVCGANMPIKVAAAVCSAVAAVSGIAAFAVSGLHSYGGKTPSQNVSTVADNFAKPHTNPKMSYGKSNKAEPNNDRAVYSEAFFPLDENVSNKETDITEAQETVSHTSSTETYGEDISESADTASAVEEVTDSSNIVSTESESEPLNTETVSEETAELTETETESTEPDEALPTLNQSYVELKAGGTFLFKVKGGRVKVVKPSDRKIVKMSKTALTALQKGKVTIKFALQDGTFLTAEVVVKTSPKLNAKSITVKKGKTAEVKIIGKAKSVQNTYKNTKYAKIISKRKSSLLTVKGLKKGDTTLGIIVNGKKLNLKVKIV